MAANAPLGLGIGWRPELALAIDRRADVGFVEILADNVDPRTPLPAPLRRLKERGVRIVVHSVGLSLGGAGPTDGRRLDHLARVAAWADAVCVSDHVAFVRAGGRGTGHLLPLPRTETALAVLCDNVARAQRALPVPLALENIAPLFAWSDATMDEPELLARLCAATDVGLVLDVSNLHASARNLGVDAHAWLERVPLARVAYAHVGGGIARGGLWHDTHAHPVPPAALALLRELRRRAPIAGAMLERDDLFPSEDEIGIELDAIAEALRPADLPEPAPPPSAAPAPVRAATAEESDTLARAQARLIEALVAGGTIPPGFDRQRLLAAADALLAKRLRTAARACPRLELQGALRERFLAWARAHPPDEDGCGAADCRRFAADLHRQAQIGAGPQHVPVR